MEQQIARILLVTIRSNLTKTLYLVILRTIFQTGSATERSYEVTMYSYIPLPFELPINFRLFYNILFRTDDGARNQEPDRDYNSS